MKRKISFLTALLLSTAFLTSASFAAAEPAGQTCVRDACFDKTREISGTQVSLKGAKLFEYLMFDVYTAAFYAPDGARSSADVLADVPKSLVLHYLRDIKPADMNRAADKMILKNPANNVSALRERIDALAAAYEKVGKGDRYELRYEPGKGTTLLLNGKEKITVPGADFAAAYFGIWVSEVPINRQLRDTLLGIEPARA